MALLDTHDLSVTFGGLRAVNEVTIGVEEGMLVGLIGPNGAGKTTFIDAITGFVPTTGRVLFDGRDISHSPAHVRARAGLARTWQSLELFDDLTVAENLQVAASKPAWWMVLADVVAPRRRGVSAAEHAMEVVGLADLATKLPDQLSQGQRKLVGVARALAAGPKLVCMDEPAAGLDSAESLDLGQRLKDVVAAGTTVFLIDHDMGLVLGVCDYIYVIEFGVLIAQGTPAQIRADERVITAYLGEQSRKNVEAAKEALAEGGTP